MVSQIYSANREPLASAFAPGAGRAAGENRAADVKALALAIAPESWVVLRQRLGLSVEQSREELASS